MPLTHGPHEPQPTSADAAERQRLLLAGQNKALELAVSGAPLKTVLEALVRTACKQAGAEARAAVFIVDREGARLRVGATAGLSEAFTQTVDGLEVGPHAPSCSMAACTGQPVMASDITQDPRWASCLDLAQAEGIRACWSRPIRTPAGEVLGALAVYHAAPREAEPGDLDSIKSLAQTAALVIGRHREAERSEQSLRASDRRWREMIDAIPAAIYTTDAEGRLTHVNPAAVAFAGHTPRLGTDQWGVNWKLYYPDGRPMPLDQCPMAVAVHEGHAVRGARAVAERPDGQRIWFEPYPAPLRDSEGRVVGGINLLIDITDRKRAEADSATMTAIVDSSDDAIISKNLDGIITSWNASACRLFGYTADEAIGRSVTMLIPPDRADEELRIIERLKRGERVDHFETIRVRKDGMPLDISLTISPVKDTDGRIVGASKIARDITERKRFEQALLASEQRLLEANATLEQRVSQRTAELERRADELRRLTAELNTVEQRERRELAQVLHDNLQQVVAVARMRIDMAIDRIEDRDARDRLREAAEYLNQTIDGMRTLATELSPPMLYYDGLVPTLQWLVRHLKDSYGLRVDLHAEDLDEAISHDLRAFVFQAIRELTFNIVKHAETDRARIDLASSAEPGCLEVTVADDGKGCDPAAIMATRSEGFGLASIRERLRGLGGDFEMLGSTAKGGCRIKMRIPLACMSSPPARS